MRTRKLKIWNGGDWNHRGGHLYICAYSWQDAVDLANEAYRKVNEFCRTTDYKFFHLSYARTYWNPKCWGVSMEGITPERGVWWKKECYSNEKPVRIV